MPRGPKGEERPADVIGNAVLRHYWNPGPLAQTYVMWLWVSASALD
jgi:hypothetical protein